VVRQYSDLVDIVKTPEEWVAVIDKRLRDPDPARIQKGIEMAKQASWECTVQKMQDLIKETIQQPDRPSARKIEPLKEAQLSYQYMATQGS
jgi:hypothetical protein